VIVKKDGSTILSKVLEVNQNDIKYKKHSNLNGPMYTINKSEVMSINYENGDKDSFVDWNSTTGTVTNNTNRTSQRLIKKPVDARNKEIVALYNHQYQTKGLTKKKSAARKCMLIFGVKNTSIMSNEDVEMTFVRDGDETTMVGNYFYQNYCINIKNKTNGIIYVDKGNCFRLLSNGTFYCYYDNTKQTTVNQGGGGAVSLGLGSVAGALGIGGVAGQLAGGISVGGGTSHSVSTTYSQQRIIAIPPHGNRNLTDTKWVSVKKDTYQRIEETESFIINDEIDLPVRSIMRGDVNYFSENELPWKREYILTYSTDEKFDTYSTINAELYIHEIIGLPLLSWRNLGEEFIMGINTNTIRSFWIQPKSKR
jgi:hypothetical protein